MEHKKELIVLYIDKDNTYHEVLLNELETQKIADELSKIFSAKNSHVMVSDTKLKLVEEVETNGR